MNRTEQEVREYIDSLTIPLRDDTEDPSMVLIKSLTNILSLSLCYIGDEDTNYIDGIRHDLLLAFDALDTLTNATLSILPKLLTTPHDYDLYTQLTGREYIGSTNTNTSNLLDISRILSIVISDLIGEEKALSETILDTLYLYLVVIKPGIIE